MVSKSFVAYAFLLCFTASVNAHAAIAPALGVKGNPARSDVQNPSSGSPCGKINIAQTLDTSTAAPASADGSFSASITDFNACVPLLLRLCQRMTDSTLSGSDGSRSIKSVKVDPSGTGKNFVAAKMIVNGDAVRTRIRYTSLSYSKTPFLESHERRHGTADRPAPCRYKVHWWHRKESVPRLLHDYGRFWQLRRGITRR